jgi:predicted TIM-barrel fold metal-dependent hydrolase
VSISFARRLSRREILAGAAVSLAPSLKAQLKRPQGPIVESHIHLFASDQKAFPYHPNAPYKPAPIPVESYVKFAREAGIEHAVIVHPEPYQNDHRYLEYCFRHELSPMFFKGTCLFDPIAPDTPDQISTLVGLNPGRIVALRIHEMRKPGQPALTSGPIHDRDLRDPHMKATWRRVGELGLAIQMHFMPHFAPAIGELASQFPTIPVILDHLGREGMETPKDSVSVLKLAKLPRSYMKFSGVEYSSKEKFPYRDVKPFVRRAFDGFGPDRILWGTLGHDMAGFEKQVELFDFMFDFVSEGDREKIRGRNALKLFHWPS